MSAQNLYHLPSPVIHLSDTFFSDREIHVDVKRDDLIHPVISGNKYRKLKGHLADIKLSEAMGLITMGGLWSNHAHATASWAETHNLPCVVLLRGPEPRELNPMLRDILSWGATLKFISRDEYRSLRMAYEQEQLDQIDLLDEYRDYYFIPEGGCHHGSLLGISQEVLEIHEAYDAVYVAVGTGTTMAGLLAAWTDSHTTFYGIQAVSATESQTSNIERLSNDRTVKWQLCDNYQFGGFARIEQQLINFMADLHTRTGLITEPVYTAKTLYALYDHVQKGMHAKGSRILFIHTGGLQGLRGYNQPELKLLCKKAGF